MLIRKLIPALPSTVIVSVNPGLCTSNLARQFQFSWSWQGLSHLI
jgi:hypothetical protein